MHMLQRLSILFVFSVVGCCTLMFLILFTGFSQLAQDRQTRQLELLMEQLTPVLLEHGQVPDWAVPILGSHGVDQLVVYEVDDAVVTMNLVAEKPLLESSYELDFYPDDIRRVHLHVQPQLSIRQVSRGTMASLIFLSIILCSGLFATLRWIRSELSGSYWLALRAKMVLNDKYKRATKEFPREWPNEAGAAISKLLAELEDARRERGRFDAFIRAGAFVDPKTGLGNAEYLENRLQSALDDINVSAGVLLNIELAELGDCNHLHGKDIGDQIIEQLCQLMDNLERKHPGSAKSRLRGDQFGLLLPRVDQAEAQEISQSLYKQLMRIELPNEFSNESFFYIGVAIYYSGETVAQVLEDSEHALRAARLQGSGGWFLVEREGYSPNFIKGTVRWRALIEQAIAQDTLRFRSREVCLVHNRESDHGQLTMQLRGPEQNWLDESICLPMALKCGMLTELQQYMMKKVFDLLAQTSVDQRFSVRLYGSTLLNRKFQRWLVWNLMQMPRDLNRRLLIELPEQQLVRADTELERFFPALKRYGCRLGVCHAGQEVVDSNYIRQMNLDMVKLHISLVREVDDRLLNQLAVRSLVGGCQESDASIAAVDIQTEAELRTLTALGVSLVGGEFFDDQSSVLQVTAQTES